MISSLLTYEKPQEMLRKRANKPELDTIVRLQMYIGSPETFFL